MSEVSYHAWTHRSKAQGGTDPIPSLALWPLKVFRDDIAVETGDGRFIWKVPEDLDAHALFKVEAFVSTAGSGDTTIQVRNVTDAVDMLTTPITIDSGDKNSEDAGTQPEVDVDNALVSQGDHISVDVDAAGGGATGLGVYFYFLASPDAVAAITGPPGADGADGADGASTAVDVSYDNGDSGLTADDVQEAIDELAAQGGGSADEVTYDNTTSGLEGENVQDALDQLASGQLPEASYVWMPLTSVVDDEPVLVWDDDDSLIPTLTPIGG